MLRKHLLILSAATALLTCKDSAGPARTPVDRVAVLGRTTVHVGYASQLAARTFAASGDTLAGRSVSWTTSDSSVASVTQTGLVRGIAAGQADVSATSEGKTGRAQLAIKLVPIARVDVTPRIDSLYVGTTLQLGVTLRDSALNVIAGPPRSVQWASSETTKAVVSDAGLVTARAAGSFAITATADDSVVGGAFLNAQHRVAALFMPESLTIGWYEVVRLIPDLRSSTGTHLSGRDVTWTTSDPTVVALSPTGVVTPTGFGTASVTASSSGLADTSRIRVVPQPVAGLTLFDNGAGVELEAGNAARIINATVVDSVGRDAFGTSVKWASSDTTIARVEPASNTDRNGLVTGVFRGAATITASAGGKTASVPVQVRLPVARFVFQFDSLEVSVGTGHILPGALEDSLGSVLTPDVYLVHYTSDDTSVAVADTTVFPAQIRGRSAGRTTMTGRTDGGLADTATIIVRSGSSDRFDWGANRLNVSNYSSWPLTLIALDSAGAPSSTPRDVTITSSDSTVAFSIPSAIPSMAHTASVMVRARRPGAARLVARANDSLFATLYVTTADIPTATVSVTPRPSTMRHGDTVRLHANVLGADGITQEHAVAWASSDPSRATVSDSGLVTAVGEGDVVISAASQGKRDSVAPIIQSANPPVIGAASPDTLTPGAAGTLTGSNFDPDPAANTVRVDGVMATVTGASADGVSFTLPPTTAFPCTPSHNALVTVTSAGRVAVVNAPLRVGVPRALALGTAVVIPAPELRCNEIGPSPSSYVTEYWLSVANTAPSADAVTAFEIRGAVPPAAQATAPVEAVAQVESPLGSSPSWGSPDVAFDRDSLRRAAAVHRELLEQSRALARRAGPAVPLLRAARAARPAVAPGLALSVVATINDIARIRIPRIEDPDFCASYRSVDARLVYSGTHGLIFEDVAAPLAGQMDSYYQAVGQEFDTRDWSVLLADFGNPLALDSLLDNNGKIAMLFTPVVNNYRLGGFVVSCDFYPESVAPSSNTGEIFYARVPTSFATGYGGDTRDNWRRFIRSIVMHESKHVTAFAERLSRGAPFEEPWLEEGSAVLAEEIWARSVYGTTWKGNATYRQTLYCDVRPAWPECANRPFAMFDPLALFYDYAREAPLRSPLGPTDHTDATFYGSAWSLLRWSIDQYATSEATFLKALVQDPALTGVENLAARAGRPIADLLSDWSLAWFADDVVTWTPSRPQLQFPSWNLRDVFAGMSQDFPAFFAPWPGSAYSLSGDFLQPVTALRGGSAAFFDFPAYFGYQMFELRAPGGGPPPPSLRLQLVRIR